MDLSIVFPAFWGREKKQVFREGDPFYEHPAALEDEGTIPAFESMRVLPDRDFELIVVVGANHAAPVGDAFQALLVFQRKWERMMAVVDERRSEIRRGVFG